MFRPQFHIECRPLDGRAGDFLEEIVERGSTRQHVRVAQQWYGSGLSHHLLKAQVAAFVHELDAHTDAGITDTDVIGASDDARGLVHSVVAERTLDIRIGHGILHCLA